ncbi:MAG: carbohydrate kinase family protein [Armatimonadota bacterium]
MAGLVGFGLVNVDIVAVVPAWERDTKATAQLWFEQIGGPVPVALCAAARLDGCEATFIGDVGEDAEADFIDHELSSYGVRSSLHRHARLRTSRSMVMLDARDGSRTLANHPGDFATRVFSPDEIERVRAAQILHVDARDLEATFHLAQVARDTGVRVSWDLGTMRPGRERLFGLCDIIIASKGGGAGAFKGRALPEDQVRGFLEAGAAIAAVTLAERGVVVGTRDGSVRTISAVPVANVKDTCGAGDTFHGAFLAATLRGADPFEAAEFACHAVAHRIRRYGHREGLPTRTDLGGNPLRRD